jgi:hypothetical protein
MRASANTGVIRSVGTPSERYAPARVEVDVRPELLLVVHGRLQRLEDVGPALVAVARAAAWSASSAMS